ncbi:MAG TPA: circadian clock protein KaiC [Vicinamibacterales bacterium]|jgi:circadian clock protein KaiC|nr:circadian clock protein KaiC [Vicinamibacterales bacterium]
MPRSRRPPARSRTISRPSALAKVATGIDGFDEITGGGLPQGRPTLVCGGPGCGKTLFALQFLVHGAAHGESGVFVTFEETEEDLLKNAASLGYDVPGLIERKRLALEYIRVERSEIEETGEYDLEGLFIRLDHALRTVRARRIALDTIESLFAGLSNAGVLRAELRRLFAWLKERGITAVITGERGTDTLTRQGLEEYVSDCVIVLDHRVTDQISTRRLRVVKYRGSSHGTNEYPFLIDRRGLAVLPVTSLQLIHRATSERISTGLDWLDEMFGGLGYFRASSVLLSGGAGTAKTTLAAYFLDAACRRGERALCFQFEESPPQYVRNMRSVGLTLDRWIRKGSLRIHAARPTLYGLEFHLATMHREIEEAQPSVAVIDPLSSFTGGSFEEVNSMVMRLIDYLKGKNITAMFTHLIPGSGASQEVEVGVSSLIDSWILLRNSPPGEHGGRHLSILKSRGMPHSSDRRSFELTDRGPVPVGPARRLPAVRKGRG